MRVALLLLISSSVAAAQHAYNPAGSFDPAVPTPRAVLGYDVGDRFTPHHMIVRYAERVAAASRRIRVDTVARTFEGRESIMVIVTSEANHSRMQQTLQDAARVASGADAGTSVARMPAIAWLGHSIHGGEASGTEASIALIYQLAAGRDPATQMILDSVVVLIEPLENPDGHERHVQDVMRMRGSLAVPTTPGAMIHQGTWPGARTSHYYFDLNRDWFIGSHPETRGRLETFNKWFPHVAVDLHEMGSNSTYFFAPPMDPFNKNVPPVILKWWDIYAKSNADAFDSHGWPYFRREGYDEFYPGYGVSWPTLTGAVGMTFEQASSSGGAIMRSDGTIMTLRDAAWHHYTAAMATLATTARRRSERVRDYAEFRRTAISEGAASPMRSIIIEQDGQGRADSLASILLRNGIEVKQIRGTSDVTVADATPYGGGAASPRIRLESYVVDLAQPQGRLAKALLEPDAVLDSSFIREELEGRRTNQPSRFYDVTAWSLPYAFRVRALTSRTSGPGDVVPPNAFVAMGAGRFTDTGSFGYAFEAGSEAAIHTLATLFKDSVRVWYAPKSFRMAGTRFPHGAFIVRAAANGADIQQRFARAVQSSGVNAVALRSALVDEGTDLGSNSVIPLQIPRVALVGGAPVQGNSFGFAWYAFDKRIGLPVTTIAAASISPALLENFNVVVVPSVGAGAFDATIGAGGRAALNSWVRAGGVLVTLDGASAWLAGDQVGISRLRLRRDSARADSAGGAPLPATVPGAILRTMPDTLSPLLAGVRSADVPVLMASDRVFIVPRDLRAGEAVLRYAELPRLRLSGYLWPEMPARIAGSPYLWTERVGRGRVIAFAGDPNFRDLWRGLLPIFANAVLLGGSF